MSDTTTTVKRSQKPRDVDYTLEVFDDLPESAIVQRTSPLEDQLEKVVRDSPEAHGNETSPGKFVRIGSYANGTAASAAANVLRKRHGRSPAVEGFEFRTARTDDKTGDPRTGLFVRYNPTKIVPGAREAEEAAIKAKAEAKAAKAAGNGAGSAAAGSPDNPVPPAAPAASAAPTTPPASGKASTPPPGKPTGKP